MFFYGNIGTNRFLCAIRSEGLRSNSRFFSIGIVEGYQKLVETVFFCSKKQRDFVQKKTGKVGSKSKTSAIGSRGGVQIPDFFYWNSGRLSKSW